MAFSLLAAPADMGRLFRHGDDLDTGTPDDAIGCRTGHGPNSDASNFIAFSRVHASGWPACGQCIVVNA